MATARRLIMAKTTRRISGRPSQPLPAPGHRRLPPSAHLLGECVAALIHELLDAGAAWGRTPRGTAWSSAQGGYLSKQYVTTMACLRPVRLSTSSTTKSAMALWSLRMFQSRPGRGGTEHFGIPVEDVL